MLFNATLEPANCRLEQRIFLDATGCIEHVVLGLIKKNCSQDQRLWSGRKGLAWRFLSVCMGGGQLAQRYTCSQDGFFALTLTNLFGVLVGHQQQVGPTVACSALDVCTLI